MKDEYLDHIIKQKMEDLKVPFQAEHWDLFVEKLDEQEGGPAILPAQEFDAQIFDKVKNHHVSNALMSKHWAQFEIQLNQLINIRETLLKYKFVELSLIILMLLLVVRWDDRPGHELLLNPPQAQNIIQSNESLNGEGGLPNISTKETNLQKEKSEIVSAPLIENTGNKEVVETMDKPIAARPTDSSSKKQVSSSDFPSSNKNKYLGPIALLEQPFSPQVVSEQALPIDASIQAEIIASSQPNAARIDLGSLDVLVSSPSLINWIPRDNILDKQIKVKPRWNTQISMAGGGEINQIITPKNEENYINASESYSLGYRGGMTLDFGKKDSPLRFGSGFIYSAKRYSVGKTFITGSLLRSLTAEELDNVEFNIINVPVFARYRFLEKKRWSMFAQAGMSIQMAMQANYYVEVPNLRNLPAPTSFNQIIQTPESQSNFVNQNDGLFEGGNFKENSFFTVNMSMGLERLMTDRFSLFFQSQYEYPMGYFSSGLGPTRDRFNTLSLETGVRVRLK